MIKKIAFTGMALVLFVLVACGDGPPHAPSNLFVESTSPVTLIWDGVLSATSYNIYRGTVSGDLSTKTLLASNISVNGVSPAVTYTDASATTGTTYYYQITSVNYDKESSASNEVQVTP